MTTRSLLRSISARLARALPARRLGGYAETHRHELDTEAGDTLVEVLIAIVVLGIAAIAMLTAFGTAFSASQEHRNLTSIGNAQKSVTQQIVAQLQNEGLYSSCAPVATYQTGANAVNFANLPNGYSAQVTGVSYWTAAFAFSTTEAQCVANSPQLISATVTYPTGQTTIVSAVVNNPSAPPPPPAGDASTLAFYTQPGGATSGQNLSPQPVVEVLDAGGNIVTTDLSQVVLTLNASNGASLSSSCTGSENFGIVTFTGCNVKLDGTYTITATDSSLTGVQVTSNPFTVSVGPPSQIAFTQQPGNATGGTAFGTQPKLTVEDAGGNAVTTDASTANLAITNGTGTSGATLSGCSQSEAAGVISFAGCNIDKSGNGYTLTATDVMSGDTLTTTSATFNVTVGAPAQLAFTQTPGSSTGGSTFSTQPWVAVEDAGGNVVTTGTGSNDQIKLSIATGAGTLACNNTTVQANAGVAKFSTCKITLGTAGSFTLTATDTSRGTVTGGTSAPFTVAGGATKLAFSVQPATATGGAVFSTAPVVWVEDAGGDLVTTANNQVTLTIKSGTGTLSGCTAAVTATGGIATFNNCKINLGTQGSFTLQAAATALTSVTSSPFSVAGAASKLIFTSQPSNSTGGVAFPIQPVVTIEDSSGNVVTTNTSTVNLSINSGTGTAGATLACSTQAATAGVATFSGCAINAAGTGYTLHAADGTLTVANSNAITITVGPAYMLGFTTQPGGGANAATWATQPAVTVEDAGGNPITGATNTVSLTIGTQPGTGAVLACGANPVNATAGVATFSGCQLVGTIGSYKLTASAPGLVNGTSAAFTITVGPAAKLAFTTQPGGGANSATWATQPAVTVEDSGGNKVTGSTASITIDLAQNAGGTLTCTNQTVTANAGVATFAGCKVTGTAGTYSLSATATGLSSATSSGFTITAGTVTQLVFTTQPGGGPNGAAWGSQPVVSAEDVSGNLNTSFASNVTLNIHSQPGTGATFSCGANPVTAGSGIATFTGCQISGAIGNYTLGATATGGLTGTSASFAITIGAPAKLAFTTQPGGGTDGVAWAVQPSVSVEDAGGNLITAATDPVALGVGTNPGGTLACTTNPLNANGGVATFAGCQITGKTGNYTLTATEPGLTSATSNSLAITIGAASKLSFTTQPGGGANAATWTTQPTVSVQDVGGNVVTSTASITLAVGTNPGGTLACTTNPLAATGGVASFGGCKITGKTGSYTLTAAAGGLTGTTSSAFNITAGTATQLAFSAQPGGGTDGGTWGNQPAVSIVDQSGNVVTTATNSVTLAIGTNPGGTLACTANPKNATGGLATFSGCQISGTLGTYTLTATATGLTNTTSNNFSITIGAPTKLAFSTQPGGGANAATWAAQPAVAVEDAGGNVVPTATNSITLAIGTNPGGALACTTNPLGATGGTASFAGCKITGKTGSYTLTATAGTLTAATSNAFTIAVGPATQLAFTSQPGGGANATTWTNQPTVAIEDQSGNLVTTATNNVTLAVGTNPGGALACTTNPLGATGGTSSFAGCKITGKTGSYTLTAAAGGLTGTTSSAFNITAGTATQLVFTTQPGGGADGATWINQPAVSIEDSSGNVVTTATNSITLAIGTNPGGTLACTANPKNATGGITAFTGCEITGTLGNYTLTASAGGLTTATSNNVPITIGAASQLAFTTEPGGGANAAAWATQPVVTIQDAGGNTVPTPTTAVTLAITTQPGSGATIACTANPKTSAAGVASFAGCAITGQTGSYTISASGGGLTAATSTPFTITFGTPSKVAFTTQPGGGANGTAWTNQPTVAIEDQSGNLVTTATNNVTLAIGTNPGGALACTTNPLGATGGTSSFAGCKITGKTGSYTLTAAAGGLTGTTSSAFNITAGTATQLVFTTQPGGGADGATWTNQPAVSIEDSSGNVVTTATNSVTLAIGTNPGGTLACTANPKNATGGITAFTGCEITGTLGNYTLTASAGGLTTATSNNVPITIGAASQLAFTTEPGGGVDGQAWATQPVVTIQDAGGNTVPTPTTAVTLAITTQPGSGATIACTANPKTSAAGVASFAGCAITGQTGSYTISASGGGLTAATSTPFTVTIGAATQLGFTTQPGGGSNGTAWSTQPAVAIEDVGGNPLSTGTNSITLALGTNPGGALACTTNPKAATGGTATFAGCKITGKTGSYTLTVAAGGLTGTTSSAFNITAGTATQLVFTTQPGGGADGATWTNQPAVSIEDSSGNVVTTATNSITLAIGTNPGGTLACTTNPVSANGTTGTASFAGCNIIGKTGTYTISASAAGLTSVTSNNLAITLGTASQLAFSTQPGGGVDGVNWAVQPVVTVQDIGGNAVTTATNQVTLAITTQPGTGAALGCNANTVRATNGTGNATFAGCDITGTTGGYALTASATGLAGTISNTFNITIGAGSQLAFTTQPGNGTGSGSNLNPQPAVSVEDVGGNLVTNATNLVTLTIDAEPTNGTLQCTPRNAVAGVATFSGCNITHNGNSRNGWTLDAGATGLAGDTSNTFRT